ncbi:ferritin-like domain-containing protein [Natranaerobius thermophilus]|uniref:Rubrerythrin n=1 Tax=Natranaerobius thermophilus (strain ATCC BAA-1301 / DSM 18059 / JW/NM-WN-LF) TaxID=457570 RepID=B2A1F1_NATTJ|nr:ferritin family protein [Natranaerobius thermophilus]ACB84691.1 Rubrerythrin [Natranaerobius thermophilus JW/NM-WN-LF]
MVEQKNLTTENVLGEAKGSDLERPVKQNFQGETSETGLYLAMARQAQREGYPEIAESLKRIAMEEAEHAARFAELNGMINDSTEENLKEMLEGEIFANQDKKKAAEKAKDQELTETYTYFIESSKDEARHAKMLEGLVNKYFG